MKPTSAPTPIQSISSLNQSDIGISDSLAIIADAYIGARTGYIDKMIDAFGKDAKDGAGKTESALDYIYKSLNYPRAEFEVFLQQKFGEKLHNKGVKGTHDFLDRLSKDVHGNFDEQPQLIQNCKKISSLSDDNLKARLGKYFKSELNKYLKSKSPNLYNLADQKFSDKQVESVLLS